MALHLPSGTNQPAPARSRSGRRRPVASRAPSLEVRRPSSAPTQESSPPGTRSRSRPCGPRATRLRPATRRRRSSMGTLWGSLAHCPTTDESVAVMVGGPERPSAGNGRGATVRRRSAGDHPNGGVWEVRRVPALGPGPKPQPRADVNRACVHPKTGADVIPWRPASTHRVQSLARPSVTRRGRSPEGASAPIHRRTSPRGWTMGDRPSVLRQLPRRKCRTEARFVRRRKPEDRALPCSEEPRGVHVPMGSGSSSRASKLASFRLRRFSRP